MGFTHAELAVMRLFRDLKIGEIVPDGRILGILNHDSSIDLGSLRIAITGLVLNGILSDAEHGLVLTEKGYKTINV